ncbi:C factor cell-cell signaling protein, partial [Coprinopsis marcescibilis]
MPNPFILVSPGATRGLGLALTRQYLRTTTLPVYTSHRTKEPEQKIKKHILEPLGDVDPKRLHLLHIDLNSEETMTQAARALQESLSNNYGGGDAYLQTAFITGGVLYPEKAPADLDWQHLKETFQVNVISHLLMIKHFSRFLPAAGKAIENPARWIHITARVGSIDDNHRGGWYSYRSSKAALNQVVKTFDLHLLRHKENAVCIGVHPGTVKTDLSKGFWGSEANRELFEPDQAAESLVNVANILKTDQRGKIWDWNNKEIHW